MTTLDPARIFLLRWAAELPADKRDLFHADLALLITIEQSKPRPPVKAIAEQAGVNPVTVWRWLRGYNRPNRTTRARLAAHGVTLTLPPTTRARHRSAVAELLRDYVEEPTR